MIPDFEINFTKIIKSLKNNNNKFILGLSGGIDSMCLLYLLKNFIDNNKKLEIDLTPVIIDHNLRVNSKREAEEVSKISQSLGFKTYVKKINECKPRGNIQNWARKQRRDILFKLCTLLSANLILAHHFDDQAETLFMRMIRETALDGLAGMSEIRTWNGIFILRPLLSYDKKQIKKYVTNKQIYYFEDNSNINLKYERVRTRFFLESMKKNIWPNISNDLNYFSKLNTDLLKKTNFIFNVWTEENVLVNRGGAVRVYYQGLKTIFDKSHLFAISIVGKIIQTVGGNEYAPKRKKTFELISSFFISKFKKKSLGNVSVSLNGGYLFFIRENRNINYEMKIKKNKSYIFDGRFLVLSSIAGKLIKCHDVNLNVMNSINPFYKYNVQINNTIPYLRTLEGKTIKPHLYTINQNSILNHRKDNSFSLYLINRILIY